MKCALLFALLSALCFALSGCATYKGTTQDGKPFEFRIVGAGKISRTAPECPTTKPPVEVSTCPVVTVTIESYGISENFSAVAGGLIAAGARMLPGPGAPAEINLTLTAPGVTVAPSESGASP